jgi:hypothetical protein
MKRPTLFSIVPAFNETLYLPNLLESNAVREDRERCNRLGARASVTEIDGDHVCRARERRYTRMGFGWGKG